MRLVLFGLAILASVFLIAAPFLHYLPLFAGIPFFANFPSTWQEMVAFVAGGWGVWLVVKEHIWNWPIGIVNSAFSAIVLFEAKLFADTGLQIIYVILGFWGWYWWLFGGENRTNLKITMTPVWEWIVCLVAGLASTAVLMPILIHFNGKAPLLDSLLTCFSLVAQYLLTKKRLENWLVWIAVDIVYVPLFISRGLYFMAILYFIYLLLAIAGFVEWLKTYRGLQAEASLQPQ